MVLVIAVHEPWYKLVLVNGPIFFLVMTYPTLTDYSTWKQFRVLNLDPSESARFDLARTDGAVKSKQDAPGQDRGMVDGVTSKFIPPK